MGSFVQLLLVVQLSVVLLFSAYMYLLAAGPSIYCIVYASVAMSAAIATRIAILYQPVSQGKPIEIATAIAI